jgi:hypothetical protein
MSTTEVLVEVHSQEKLDAVVSRLKRERISAKNADPAVQSSRSGLE